MRDLPRREIQRAAATTPTQGEYLAREALADAADLYARGMAVLVHALILLSLPGLALVALIWLLHRHRVPFVERHARQAMRWQAGINVISLLTAVVLLVLLFGGLNAGLGKPSTGDAIGGSLAIVALLGLLLLFVGWIVLALVSAVVGASMALLGREPRLSRSSRKRA